ncbi:hypothetical protein [Paucibacter sp. Y2R2-4]|uniref:hypothetical protein n=1 Tax=Paucibacter sp. Y2R2-4 TaxID=2893553 RepID=UPI0021E42E61|nr:hypothetical protein [Paucibacter sp. Y2R2-4]MCV2349328.1 hypothetical protein [Paucibacter sp. Y2R2-4]
MAAQTIVYARPQAGRLEVILSGVYSANLSNDAGFPMSGNATITLECQVLNGGGGQMARVFIDRMAATAHVFLDYPGGNTPWTVSVDVVRYTYGGGLGSIGVTPKVSFILIKK